MKPFIRFNMAGYTFEVPTAAIVRFRAAGLQAIDPKLTASNDAAIQEALGMFGNSEERVAAWAKQHMQWREIAPHARIIAMKMPDFNALLAGSEVESTSERTQIDLEASGGFGTGLPLELLMGAMADGGQVCASLSIGPKQAPYAGVAVFIGDEYVSTYLATLESLTAHIVEEHNKRAVAAAAANDPAQQPTQH